MSGVDLESQTPFSLWKQQGPKCFMCFRGANWRRRLHPLHIGTSCQSAKQQCPAIAVNADVHLPRGGNRRVEEKVTNPRATEAFALPFCLMCRCLHHERLLRRAGKLLFKENKSISQHLRKTPTTSLGILRSPRSY